MTAIIDGDILAYRAAFWADSEGEEWLEGRIVEDLKRWTPPGVDNIVVALSCKREDNFRRDWLPDYKRHRTDRPSPACLKYAIEIIKDNAIVTTEDRLEADDLIGIYMCQKDYVGVSIDKDLQQIPGRFWKPPTEPGEVKGEIKTVSLQEADLFFHQQWITGDSTDNIPGIWKMGPKKAGRALESTSAVNHTALVLVLYEQALTKDKTRYTYDDAVANGKAVRILRGWEDTLWMPL